MGNNMKYKYILTLVFTTLMLTLSACGDRLTADQISKMTEEEIKLVTPDQIGEMTPGELEVFKTRQSHFASERTRAEIERAKNKTATQILREHGM